MSSKTSTLFALSARSFTLVLLLLPAFGRASAVVNSGSSADAAGLLSTVNAFRTNVSLGGANNGSGGSFPTGRREVNWDGAASDPFQFDASKPAPNPVHSPDTFFNNQVPRGLITTTPDGAGVFLSGRSGSTNGDGSANTDVRFNTSNATYADQFKVFSAQRLFAVDSGLLLDVTFRVAGSPTTDATVNGFGSVFADVDLPGLTKMDFYGVGNILLGSYDVPVFSQGLSFLGVTFDNGEQIERVRITLGNTPLLANAGITETPNLDVVVMDDFIYGEPIAKGDFAPVPEPSTYAFFGVGALGLVMAIRERRRRSKFAA